MEEAGGCARSVVRRTRNWVVVIIALLDLDCCEKG